jgi:hypothetical protein
MRRVSFQFLLPCAVVACLWAAAVPAHAVTIDWVTVGDPGNAYDTINTGTNPNYGAVADSFRIMKFEFTNQQYTDFLNSVDPNGTNPNSVYSESGLGIARCSALFLLRRIGPFRMRSGVRLLHEAQNENPIRRRTLGPAELVADRSSSCLHRLAIPGRRPPLPKRRVTAKTCWIGMRWPAALRPLRERALSDR